MSHQDWNPVIFNNKPKDQSKREQNIDNRKCPKTQVVITQRERNLDSSDVEPPPKVDINLRRAIQQARQFKKLTQKELAQLVGVQQSEITNYENGKAIPNNQFIARLERSLGCKLPRINKQR